MSKTSVLGDNPDIAWEPKFSGLGFDLTGLRPFHASVWQANGETGGKVYRVSICNLKMKKIFPANRVEDAKRYAECTLAMMLRRGADFMAARLAEQNVEAVLVEQVKTPKRRMPKGFTDDPRD